MRPRGARAHRGHRARHRGGLLGGRAPPSSAARPRSTPACWVPTSTTWPAPRPASSRPTSCSGPERVRAGDVLVALGSSGLHSNGYSLVRKVVAVAGWSLDRHVDELGRTLGEELLEPTRVYAVRLPRPRRARRCRRPARATATSPAAGSRRTSRACCRRASSRTSTAAAGRCRRSSRSCSASGQVPWTDLEGTLNLGVGMVAIVARRRRGRRPRARAPSSACRPGTLGTVRHADPSTDVVGRTRASSRAPRACTAERSSSRAPTGSDRGPSDRRRPTPAPSDQLRGPHDVGRQTEPATQGAGGARPRRAAPTAAVRGLRQRAARRSLDDPAT